MLLTEAGNSLANGARRDRAFRNLDEVLDEVQKIQEFI